MSEGGGASKKAVKSARKKIFHLRQKIGILQRRAAKMAENGKEEKSEAIIGKVNKIEERIAKVS